MLKKALLDIGTSQTEDLVSKGFTFSTKRIMKGELLHKLKEEVIDMHHKMLQEHPKIFNRFDNAKDRVEYEDHGNL